MVDESIPALGQVVFRSSDGWDIVRRGFAARADYEGHEPLAVLYARCVEDVTQGLVWARARGMEVRVRSGGHSFEGYSSLVKDGLILDLSQMCGVSFDHEKGLVRAEAGIQMAGFSEHLCEHGVTLPLATGPTVGLGGLCLGGGLGLSSRLLGLTCDRVVEIEMVTAAGEVLIASEEQHTDLFWALRGGGGGNFGIATAFTLKTHPLTTMGLFNLTYSWEEFEAVVDAWQNWAPTADWGITSLLSLRADRTVTFQGQYTAEPENLERLEELLEPMAKLSPIRTDVVTVPVDMGTKITLGLDPCSPSWANPPLEHGQLFKTTSAVAMNLLPFEAILALKIGLESVPSLHEAPSQPSMVQLLSAGGRGAVPLPDETAVFYRDAKFVIQYDGYWTSPEDQAPTVHWVRAVRRSLLPYTNGAYVNYVDSDLGAEWLEQYYGSNVPRLQEVKRRYDPENFFQFEQSIPV